MLVCHCHAVCDETIRQEIGAGALSPDDLAARCGAGARCGGCHETIEALLERASSAARQALEPA